MRLKGGKTECIRSHVHLYIFYSIIIKTSIQGTFNLLYTQFKEEKYMGQLGNLVVKIIGSQNFNQVL